MSRAFFQVYTVHGQRDGKISPACMHMLPNKTEATYNRFFLQLFNVMNEDFENTAIKALRAQKPGIEVKGCFFHLRSSIWKHTKFRSKYSLQRR